MHTPPHHEKIDMRKAIYSSINTGNPVGLQKRVYKKHPKKSFLRYFKDCWRFYLTLHIGVTFAC